MTYTVGLLIGFMALTGYKDDVVGVGQLTRGLNGFPTICNRQYPCGIWGLHPRRNLLDNGLGVFGPGIIGCENGPIAHFCSDIAHYRTLRLVSIATTPHNGDDVFISSPQCPDGLENIF